MLGFITESACHATATSIDDRGIKAGDMQELLCGRNSGGVTICCRRAGFLVAMAVEKDLLRSISVGPSPIPCFDSSKT
jgi:hypothetical protein